jgi:hypothetical protein
MPLRTVAIMRCSRSPTFAWLIFDSRAGTLAMRLNTRSCKPLPLVDRL